MTGGDVLLVTGATSGIGAAVAELAAQRGRRLVLAARDAQRLDRLVDRLGGEQALAFSCDVTRWEDVAALAEAAEARFGRIDAVFANAGVGGERGILEGDPGGWRTLVETNVLGVAYTLRATAPHLRRSGNGHAVLMGSVAGRWITPGSVYAATKAAVAALADALRAELRDAGDRSTRVTLVEAGWVNTPLLRGDRPGAMPPLEIAEAVLYALDRPPGVDLNQITLRPTTQRE